MTNGDNETLKLPLVPVLVLPPLLVVMVVVVWRRLGAGEGREGRRRRARSSRVSRPCTLERRCPRARPSPSCTSCGTPLCSSHRVQVRRK